VTADSGKQGRRKAVALLPDLSKVGQQGQRRLFHNSIIGIFWFMTTELKQIFYRFLYYFWGQHCCWTVASIIGYDFYVFHKFPLPSTFLLPLSPIDVPASLVSLLFHLCDHFSIFAILPLPYFSITILVGSQIFWWLMMGNKKGPNTNVLHYELKARLSILLCRLSRMFQLSYPKLPMFFPLQ